MESGLDLMVRSRLYTIESDQLSIQIYTSLTNVKIILITDSDLSYQTQILNQIYLIYG